MQRLFRSAAAIAMTLVLGACGTGATPSPVATTAPATAAAPATAGAPVSAAPASATAAASSAAACAPAAAGVAATVKVTIKNFAFSPEPVTAKVGDVIGWTNNDSISHTATLDDGSCTTDTIGAGTTLALVFSAPGTYPYHCSIHPTQMMGKITITG